MGNFSIENLPTEMIFEIMYKMTPRDLLKTCKSSKIFLFICDWDFWANKAHLDFGVSRAYFDLPKSTPEGVGSFAEIPLWFCGSSSVEFSEGRDVFGPGGFRYCQIASRYELLPEFVFSSYNQFGFIEPAACFFQARSGVQTQILPTLLKEIPIERLTEYVNCFFPLSDLMKGNRKGICFSENVYFDLEALKEVVSPSLRIRICELVELTYPGFSFCSQIQDGKISPELENFLQLDVNREGGKYKEATRNIVQTVAYLGHSNLLPLIRKPLRQLVESDDETADRIFCSALSGGSEELVKEILGVRNMFFNKYGDESHGYHYHVPAHFGGNLGLIEIVKQNVSPAPWLLCEDYLLPRAYLQNRRPEDYLQILKTMHDVQRMVPDLCVLGDTDILSYLLSLQKPDREHKTPFRVALRFFSDNIAHLLGHLDVVAWMIRVLKTLPSTPNDKRLIVSLAEKAENLQIPVVSGEKQLCPNRFKFNMPYSQELLIRQLRKMAD